MGNSLQDQLLKAGMVDKKKAKKVAQEKQKKHRQKNKGARQEIDVDKLEMQRKMIEQIKRDKALNQERVENAQVKALKAEVVDLIEKNICKKSEGNPADDVPYNFVDSGKVKKIFLSKENHKKVVSGSLQIIRYKERYELVTAAVADKIEGRDSSVVLRQESSVNSESNDEYAGFEVPDDLTW